MACHATSGSRKCRARLVTSPTVTLSNAALPVVARLSIGCITAIAMPLLFGLPANIWAQELTMQITEPIVRQGEQFEIVLSLADGGRPLVIEPQYPSIVEPVGAPLIAGNRDADAFLTVTILLRAVRPGRGVLEPIGVQTLGRTYYSEPRVLTVSERGDINSVPYDVEWHLHNNRLYTGQTGVVSLDIYNTTDLFFPEEIGPIIPTGVEFEEIQGLGEIETQTIGDIELLRFPIAVFLLTASAADTITLPSVIVSDGRIRRRAPRRQLHITPLPDTGVHAIGDVRFSAELNTNNIIEGDAALLTLRVSGEGNLRFLQFPEVRAEDIIITEQEEIFDLLPSFKGYRGIRNRVLRLAPTVSGSLPISIGNFRWYDPDRDTVDIHPEQRLMLNVISAQTGDDSGTNEEQSIPPILSPDDVWHVQPLWFYRSIWTYVVTIVPPILVGVLVLFLRRRRTVLLVAMVPLFIAASAIPTDTLNASMLAGHTAYLNGDLDMALAHFEQAAQELPDSPGLLYNMGLIDFFVTNHARGIYRMRNALYLNPTFDEARDALYWMEGRLNLQGQIAPTSRLSSTLFLPFLVGAPYLLLVAIILLPRLRQGMFTILLVFVIVFMLYGIGGLTYLFSRSNDILVVATQPTHLLRIPSPYADPWLPLMSGTALQHLNSHDGFYNVRTGHGVEGWIANDTVLSARDR